MQISLKWLNEYVDVSPFYSSPKGLSNLSPKGLPASSPKDLPASGPEALSELLTNAGLEVENIENKGAKFHHVVIGQVAEYDRHPDADKLTLCQVDVGDGQLRQIVCGAKNHKQGDKVVVALPGAVLPGDFKIKESKIRGVESKGMLCSASELGLEEESEGIVILPEDAVVGMPFAEATGLDDIVFELSVTPNRSDCLSHYGLAREIAAMTGAELKPPKIDLKTSGSFCQETVSVKLKAADACQRYAGRLIKNVEVKASPAWLKQRLESVGLNSINNVVDVTNFVMLELGQPLHAFDVAQINGNVIIIDKANPGESFQTLDGTKITLTGNELTIRDANGPVALAGIVGGVNSGVSENTRDIFLEAAYFTQETVRRTARQFGIETDSGYRFSRGTNPEGVLNAMDRACDLIQQVAGGVVSEDFHDCYPQPIKKSVIELSHQLLQERLGYVVVPKDFLNWMQRLGCQDVGSDEGVYRILPPAFRWDLEQGVDLVEEYARLNGYDKIPETFPPLFSAPTGHVSDYLEHQRMIDLMNAEGYLQAVNYGFISDLFQSQFLGDQSKLKGLGLATAGESVTIKNPLSEDLNIMRSSLSPGLFKNMLNNIRYGSSFGRLFESGYVFTKGADDYQQLARLGLMAWGQMEGLWQKPEHQAPVVYELKRTLENLLAKLNVASFQWRTVDPVDVPEFLHPGQCASLFFEGKSIGFIGSLHPSLLHEHKIRQQVALAELDRGILMRGQPRKPKVKALSKFPPVERDFAFVVPNTLPVDDVLKTVKKAGGAAVSDIRVMDQYVGPGISEDARSVTIRIYCQSEDHTFSETELNALHEKVIGEVKRKLSIEVR